MLKSDLRPITYAEFGTMLAMYVDWQGRLLSRLRVFIIQAGPRRLKKLNGKSLLSLRAFPSGRTTGLFMSVKFSKVP